MRVTHVVTKLDVGGAQTHVAELALGQTAAGHQVEVVTGVEGPASHRLEAADVPVTVVPALGDSHGRLSQRAALVEVTAAIRRTTPDLVHGHSSNAGLAARLAARRLGIPAVYTAHGWPFQRGAPLRQRAMSLAGEFVGGRVGDAVIVLTEAERRRAVRAKVVARRRLFVVPNGIADVDSGLIRSPAAAARPPVLVMVARFAPPKQQSELVEAMAQLADVPWTLRLVGDGPHLEQCRAEFARQTRLAGRVQFLGHRDDVAEILAASDVGILWSRYEGLPISVMEYMRAGLCCVASDLPGTRELFGAEQAGLVAGSGDDLVAKLAALLASPAQVDKLGQQARRRYLSHYSVGAMVDATDAVYRKVLARRPATRSLSAG